MEKLKWLDAYLTEAETLIMDGSITDGLALMQRLLYEEPGYAALHNYLGWAYCYYAENGQQAESHWKWAIQFDKDLAAPYLHLGRYYREKRNYSEAVRYLSAGMDKPDAIREVLLENLAHVYELQGKYRKAVETYKEALAACVGHQSNAFLDGIKRCRRKRWALLFGKRSISVYSTNI